MKILGVIFYIMAYLGPAYIITETRISFSDSFLGILAVAGWIFGCMLVGKLLMGYGEQNNGDKE